MENCGEGLASHSNNAIPPRATVGACFNTCKSAAAPSDGSTGNTAYSDSPAYVFAECKGIQEDVLYLSMVLDVVCTFSCP